MIPEFDSSFDYLGWDCVGQTETHTKFETEEVDFDEMVERIAVRERRSEYEKSRLHDGRNCDDYMALL